MANDGIYVSHDTYQKLQGDLFSQTARARIADQFGAQAQAALPSMVDTAQQAEYVRQAAEARAAEAQRQAAEQASRDANAATFAAQAPAAIASHPDVVAQQQRDQNAAQFQQQAAPTLDALTQHLGGGQPSAPEALPNAPDQSPGAPVDTSAAGRLSPSPSVPAPDVSAGGVNATLQQRGWSADAAGRVSDTVPFSFTPGLSPAGAGGADEGMIGGLTTSSPGGSAVDVYGDNGMTNYADPGYGGTVEHEAHHAWDAATPAIAQRLATPAAGQSSATDDANALRQYAAVTGNRDLFDAANNALAQNDPAHLNTTLVNAAGIEGAPDWYKARYLGYRAGSPTWTGAELNPAATPRTEPATPTTAGLSGGGDMAGRVGATGQAILSAAGDAASWLGDQGQKALQAILVTEGGLAGARGDKGQSAGPLQFYSGGQLANFAQQHGISQDAAMKYVEANPEAAVQWAIGTPEQPGYLGAAILKGQQQGLTGPDLATYAQQHGQVSVSPERAGQNWNALFGNGSDPISGMANGAMRLVNTAVQNVLSLGRPSQFGVGLSSADAYAACGPVAALAFAKAAGREPTAQEAVDLAKSVGWTQAQGMAGPASEVDLLKRMGVASHLESGADPTKIAQDVSNGNPVIISTTGHYFTADGARTAQDGTQEFHVGTSGTDLRGGAEWMTLGQMQNAMGAIQGTLYMDRKPGDGPSVAVQSQAAQAASAASTDQTAASTGPAAPLGPLDHLKNIGDTISSAITSGLQGLFGNIGAGAAQMQAGQQAQTAGIQQAAQGVGTMLTEPQPWMQNVVGAQTKQMQAGAGVSPYEPGQQDLSQPEQYAQARGIATGLSQTLGPEDLMARAATGGAGSLARSGEVAQDVLASKQPAQATVGFASGADALGHLAQPVETSVADAAGTVVPTSRFYHGTGGDFARPDAAKFDANGLFGPGYYMTDSPEVAGGNVSKGRFGVDPETGRTSTYNPTTGKFDTYMVDQGKLDYPGYAQARPNLSLQSVADLTDRAITEVQGNLGYYQRRTLEDLQKLRDQIPGFATASNLSNPAQYAESSLTGILGRDSPNPETMLKKLAPDIYGTGGNVRAVDVPQNLNLLNADAPLTSEAAHAIADQLPEASRQTFINRVLPAENTNRMLAISQRGRGPATGEEAYRALDDLVGGGVHLVGGGVGGPEQANKVLADAGFDGIQYAGGQRVPMTGTDGNPIEHTAVNIFPSSLDKLRNAISGTQGGSATTQFATTLGGAAAGGGATYAATDPNDPNRILKIAGGALAGGAAGFGAAGAVENAMAGEGRLIGHQPVPPQLPGMPPLGGTPDGAELFRAYHTSNVISGLATMTHVAVNSILAPAWSFTTRGAADVLGGAAGLATGGRVGLDTGMSRVAGSGVGFAAGLADSGAAFAASIADHFADPALLGNRVQNPIGSALLKAQSVPGSLHGAFQSAAQMVIEKAELGRLAGEEASQQGLTGQAWTAHVADAIANPAGQIAQQAQATAQRAVLRGDLGTLAATAQRIANIPVLGNTLFPVVRIAANSLAQGIEATPLGLIGTGIDVARGLAHTGPYGGAAGLAGNGVVAPLAERLTNNIAGTALTAWLASKAMDGSITGAGPDDPKKKAQMVAQGWQPDSAYLPGRGYVDIHTLGKLAVPFSMAGDYADAVNYGGAGSNKTSDPGAIATKMAMELGGYLEDQTGIKVIGQMYDAFHKQGAAAALGTGVIQSGASLAGGFVPGSALVRGLASATDPNVRKADPGNFGQALSMGIPGLREQVPPKLDTAGNPEPNPQYGLGVFAPRTGVVTQAAQDPVTQTLAVAGLSLGKPPVSIQVAKAQAGYPAMSVDLTPTEQTQYQQLRTQALRDLGILDYNKIPDFATTALTDSNIYKPMKALVAQADKQAAMQLAAQIPNDQMDQRIAASTGRKTKAAPQAPVLQSNVPLSLTPVPPR